MKELYFYDGTLYVIDLSQALPSIDGVTFVEPTPPPPLFRYGLAEMFVCKPSPRILLNLDYLDDPPHWSAFLFRYWFPWGWWT